MKRTSAQRPYWLLLVLALFIAGQAAVAGHWHDKGDPHRAECALCALSSANSAAAIDSQPLIIVAALFVAVYLFTLPSISVGCSRCYDSRAPPAYS